MLDRTKQGGKQRLPRQFKLNSSMIVYSPQYIGSKTFSNPDRDSRVVHRLLVIDIEVPGLVMVLTAAGVLPRINSSSHGKTIN